MSPPGRLRGAFHPRVAPTPSPAQEARAVDTERGQRRRQLADAIPAQLVGAVHGELRPPLADDLALLTERACDDLHLRTAGHVVRDRRARGEGLVVGMSMDEKQPRGLHSDQLACSSGSAGGGTDIHSLRDAAHR